MPCNALCAQMIGLGHLVNCPVQVDGRGSLTVYADNVTACLDEISCTKQSCEG